MASISREFDVSDLLELAARCEAATGPNLAVDVAIENACVEPTGFPKKWIALAYSKSLDAAMTLVPEGWMVANISQTDAGTWWAELRKGYITSYSAVAMSGHYKVATPALALTAAALRARNSLPTAAPAGSSSSPASLHSLGTGAAEAAGESR